MEDSDLVKKRKRLEKERSESCFKRNGPDIFGPCFYFELEPIFLLQRLLKDGNRNYMGKLCHMKAWDLF
jgi:hypothetical protein